MKTVRTFEKPIGAFYGETLSTSTTITGVSIPPHVQEVNVYEPSNDFRMQLGPALAFCGKTLDNEKTFINFTTEAKDRSTSTSVNLISLSTAANGDYWYLASKFKFAGATIDVGAASDQTSTMTGYYWDGSNWTNASITDGTVSSNKTLATDGNITFTVPSAWQPRTMFGIESLYIIRFQVSAALGAATTIYEAALLPDTTANPAGYFESATVYNFNLDTDVAGSVCIYLAADTGTSYITWMKHYL